MNLTLQQLMTMDAVVTQGSIQAGARLLNKTHPSVIAVLKNMESELGFALFDRAGYRTVLTDAGRTFHASAKQLLTHLAELKDQAAHLKGGEESELNIVIGDITPLPLALKVLRSFSNAHPYTRLNLFFGNLFGPNELLFDGEADLIIHHIDQGDARYEYRNFCKVDVLPVVAPDFLKLPVRKTLRYEELKGYTQCIIRDTSTHSEKLHRFVIDDAPHLTVGDQYTKKEVIVQGMGWGHMPAFLIEDELRKGSLISIAGKYIKAIQREIVIARLSAPKKGVMAERLWQSF